MLSRGHLEQVTQVFGHGLRLSISLAHLSFAPAHKAVLICEQLALGMRFAVTACGSSADAKWLLSALTREGNMLGHLVA